jgi:hypothetical protein
MSLLRFLDRYDVHAQIRLERQTHRGAFLVVEGETDYKAIARFFNPNHCSIIIANGKKNALKAMDLSIRDGFDRVICIVDADFDCIQGIDCSSEIIWLTDSHDMDLTIFKTSAADRRNIRHRLDTGFTRGVVRNNRAGSRGRQLWTRVLSGCDRRLSRGAGVSLGCLMRPSRSRPMIRRSNKSRLIKLGVVSPITSR